MCRGLLKFGGLKPGNMNTATGDLLRKIYYWIYILAADKQTVISQIQLLV